MNVAPADSFNSSNVTFYQEEEKNTKNTDITQVVYCYFNLVTPMLNSNMTITVRIAQIQNWEISGRGFFQNMNNDTNANANPIFRAYMIFLGSFRPISIAFLTKSNESFQHRVSLSYIGLSQIRERLSPSFPSSPRKDGSNLSLLISTDDRFRTTNGIWSCLFYHKNLLTSISSEKKFWL